jgi:hypothetical protein
MPIYNSASKGPIDTAEMAYPYLVNALNKAQAQGDQDNIDALTQEIAIRDAQNQSFCQDVPHSFTRKCGVIMVKFTTF